MTTGQEREKGEGVGASQGRVPDAQGFAWDRFEALLEKHNPEPTDDGLRDYFAAAALSGLCANTSMFDGLGTASQCAAQVDHLTDRAVAIADAMLTARQERSK